MKYYRHTGLSQKYLTQHFFIIKPLICNFSNQKGPCSLYSGKIINDYYKVQNKFLTAKFNPVHLVKINNPLWCAHYLEGRSQDYRSRL